MNERTATPGQDYIDYSPQEVEQALTWLDERDGILG